MSLMGIFEPSGDKSISHRLGIFSLLAKGVCLVSNYSLCVDCKTTLESVCSLGGKIYEEGPFIKLIGIDGTIKSYADVDCKNSGTTMRLIAGLLAASNGSFSLFGDNSLSNRSMQELIDFLKIMGGELTSYKGKPPLKIKGKRLKRKNDYVFPVTSAQIKSALLLASVKNENCLKIKDFFCSRDHTERLLKMCGARIEKKGTIWKYYKSKLTLPNEYKIPGDISSAAFPLCGAIVVPGSKVIANKVLLNSTRVGFLTVLKMMKAMININKMGEIPEPWGSITAQFTPKLYGCQIRENIIPSLIDEIPILALVATQAIGTTVFHSVGSLRNKESDRLFAIVSQLTALGGELEVKNEDLIIKGPSVLRYPFGKLNNFGDHRIVMTLAIARLLIRDEKWKEDAGLSAISYPNFVEDMEKLLI